MSNCKLSRSQFLTHLTKFVLLTPNRMFWVFNWKMRWAVGNSLRRVWDFHTWLHPAKCKKNQVLLKNWLFTNPSFYHCKHFRPNCLYFDKFHQLLANKVSITLHTSWNYSKIVLSNTGYNICRSLKRLAVTRTNTGWIGLEHALICYCSRTPLAACICQ